VEVSDVVFLHHFSGVAGVPHILELLGRDLARVLHEDLLPARMLVEELGDVVDLVVQDEPDALVLALARLVLLHLLESDHFRHVNRRTTTERNGRMSRRGSRT